MLRRDAVAPSRVSGACGGANLHESASGVTPSASCVGCLVRSIGARVESSILLIFFACEHAFPFDTLGSQVFGLS